MRPLVVEDERMFQELLVTMLRSRTPLREISGAETAAAAVSACSRLQPDLLILDIALPDGDGLTVARALQQLKPEARMIVLSSHASTFQRPHDLCQNIVAVVDKSRAFDELAHEIQALLGSEASPAAADDDDDPEAVTSLVLQELPRRERQVMIRIGQGQSNKAMAEQLGLSVRTVESHRRNIAIKLGCSGARLVRIATLLNQQLV